MEAPVLGLRGRERPVVAKGNGGCESGRTRAPPGDSAGSGKGLAGAGQSVWEVGGGVRRGFRKQERRAGVGSILG